MLFAGGRGHSDSSWNPSASDPTQLQTSALHRRHTAVPSETERWINFLFMELDSCSFKTRWHPACNCNFKAVNLWGLEASCCEAWHLPSSLPSSLSVPICNDEEDAGFTGKRFNSKMVVYSGSKTSYLPKMMTLYEQCIRVLQNNIDCEWSCWGYNNTHRVPTRWQ